MKTHTVAIVAFVAAALALAAYFASSRNTAAPPDADCPMGPALPTLATRLNDAAEITVHRSTGAFTFRRTIEGWGLKEKDGYPANFENLRGLIVGLAQLQLVEAKTANHELFARIGVQDVSPADPPADGSPPPPPESQNVHVEVRDNAGTVLASVILGTQKWGAEPEVFIRRAGESQSFLARGRVDVPWDQMAWLDKTIVNFPRDRVRAVTLERDGAPPISVSRISPQFPAFLVENLPEGRELTTPGAGDQIGNLLNFLSLEDVRAAENFDFDAAAPGPSATVHLFDGTVISLRSALLNGASWAVLRASFDEPPPADDQERDMTAIDAARAEAGLLDQRLARWAFKLPDHKVRVLQTTWDALLKPIASSTTADEETPDGEE
ncbi:MAG: DUF4340 domain-containing protein [Phycisphaeraceae bacterium]|nr:DUF4340 domain-containing protein [Phycisphaeraceae bacterium]